MTVSRWDRLQDLYLSALERPPEAREAYLEGADVDASLRDEVREMLAVTTASRALRVEGKLVPADEDANPWGTDPLVDTTLGRYRLVERIGRGGMGDVYRATWSDGEIRHEVAVKLLRTSALTEESVTRFRGEQAILARLTHPAIVGLMDTGVTPEGRPYFVMPVVRGTPLTRWCDDRALAIPGRLDLFRRVCEAVHHAHRNLVVHRDLKPSNVLVTDDGNVQLLDFGIAKLMDPTGEVAAPTRTGHVLMTPEYASPEQVRGEPTSTAVDVYALGVMLYELLSGARPHAVGTGSGAELERAICDTPPARLVTHVSADTAARRSASSRDLERFLRGDLQTIVTKALHKDPDRRYGSAAELAEDVHRSQRSLPVLARPDTWTYRARTFVRRNRAGSIAAAVVACALVATAATFFTQSRRASAERDRLTGVVDALTDVFESVNPLRVPGVDTLDVATFVARSEGRILAAVSGDPILEGELAGTFGALRAAREEWTAADSLLFRAFERRRSALGERHPATASALHDYAELHYRLGAADAESLLQASLAAQRQLSASPTRDLAEALIALAAATDSWETRRGLLAEAIEVSDAACGDDPVCRARGYNALATACFARDSLEAAAALFERALDDLRRVLPETHPNVMTVTQNLAATLSGTGDLARAESLFVALVEREESRLGERTSRIGLRLNNLALTRLARGRHAEGLATLEHALEIQRDAYGPVHPHVANTLYNLFSFHLLRGEIGEAQRMLDAAVTACGPSDTAHRRVYERHRALIDLASGHPEAARDTLRVWRRDAQALPESRSSVTLRFILARAFLASGQPDSALVELERVRRYYAERGGHRREMLAAVDGVTGLCLVAQGRRMRAAPLVESALATYAPFGLADVSLVAELRRAEDSIGSSP